MSKSKTAAQRRNDERLQVAVILALENKARRNRDMSAHPQAGICRSLCVAEILNEVKTIAERWAEGKKL